MIVTLTETLISMALNPMHAIALTRAPPGLSNQSDAQFHIISTR